MNLAPVVRGSYGSNFLLDCESFCFEVLFVWRVWVKRMDGLSVTLHTLLTNDRRFVQNGFGSSKLQLCCFANGFNFQNNPLMAASKQLWLCTFKINWLWQQWNRRTQIDQQNHGGPVHQPTFAAFIWRLSPPGLAAPQLAICGSRQPEKWQPSGQGRRSYETQICDFGLENPASLIGVSCESVYFEMCWQSMFKTTPPQLVAPRRSLAAPAGGGSWVKRLV